MQRLKKFWFYLAVLLLMILQVSILLPTRTLAASSPFTMKLDSNPQIIHGTYKTDDFTLQADPSTLGSPTWRYNLTQNTALLCSGPSANVTLSATAAQSGHGGTGTASGFKYKSSASSGCDSTYSGPQPVAGSNGQPPPPTTIDWTGATGVFNSAYSDNKELDVTMMDGTQLVFQDSNTSDSNYNYKPTIPDFFAGTWCKNTLYNAAGNNDPSKGVTLNAKPTKATSGSVNADFDAGSGCITSTGTITITPASSDNNGNSGNGTTNSTDGACFTNWSLAWLVCPVIDAAQHTANALYGFVEDQLKFTVSQNGNQADSLGASHTDVHNAWNNFRIIVSGLVVILLLVMVISQAIGSGPFDAYTVKKMLPRIVIGVILIQVSWQAFAYIINVVDRLGIGLADLMYAPFGGADKMNLYALLNPFGSEAVAFSWVGIPALVIFGVVAPFVVLTLLLSVLIAILVGFLTLLFRKILIILALIFVPVALIFWMMPNDGLRVYWKRWWENFSKALLMFPLIIAIIAAGRIFAKIGGAEIDFVGFFIVLVGFFGPLFLLPKTFKWGGTVMQSAGENLNKLGQKASSKQKDLLTNPEKAVGGWWARRQGLHASEYTDKDPFRKRVYHSMLAGRLLPTRRAKGAMIFRGNEFKAKEQELEKAIQERRREKQASREGNVMAGKRMDLEAIEEGSRKAYDAQRRGLLGTQKKAERQTKEAMRDLIATGSTLELNNETIMDSDGKRKYVWQTKMWADLLNGNPELYRQVKADAPDWVPHRTPVGLPKYREAYSAAIETADRADLTARGITGQELEAEIYRRKEAAQWSSSLHETVTELDAGSLATLHPTYYERIGDRARQGHEYLRQAETGRDAAGRVISEHEKARLKELGTQLQEPAVEFGRFIEGLSKDAAGRQYLARAKGGGDTMEHLDSALQYSGIEGANSAEGYDYRAGNKGRGSLDAIYNLGLQQEAARMRGEGETPGGGETEVVIPHDEPRIITPDDRDFRPPTSADLPR